MPTTALLLRASANRVYGESAFALAEAELGLVGGPALAAATTRREALGGVDYLLVEHPAPLDGATVARLANLSSLHAAFAVEGHLLRPVDLRPVAAVPEDLTTIQRYPGKTNEAFTHLLVNVALAAGGSLDRLLAGERLRLIDPACGRGTTLNRAACYGMDACGVEVDQRDVEAYTVFLLTWLKDHRYKHELQQAKLRKGRERPAHRITVTYGPGKDRAAHRVVDVIHDDMRNARSHLTARSMDLLACDLPYGVQHGAQASGRAERGPQRLLESALPVWHDLLRPGAGVALAWNRRTMRRPELAALLAGAGFELCTRADEDAFVHRVDRSIERDVITARRPR